MDDTLLTPEQVATQLQVTPRTIYDWLRQGRLRGVKLGRLWRVTSHDLRSFLGAGAATTERIGVPLPDHSREPSRPSLTEGEPASGPEGRDEGDQEERRGRDNEAAIRLLDEWMADESGFDEQTWPIVKRVIEENRLSYRKRFDD